MTLGVCRRFEAPFFGGSTLFGGGTPAVAFVIHFDDGGMVDEPVDGRDGNRGIWKHLVPFAERLIAGDDEAFAFIALGNEFEQDGGFGLIFADIAEIIEIRQSNLSSLARTAGRLRSRRAACSLWTRSVVRANRTR